MSDSAPAHGDSPSSAGAQSSGQRSLTEREAAHLTAPAHVGESDKLKETVDRIALSARRISRQLGRASATQRAQVIKEIAQLLIRRQDEVLAANHIDLDRAEHAALSEAMIDRLRLTPERLSKLSESLEEIAAAPDLIGEVSRQWDRPNGLSVSKMRLPLGVIMIIYESRPNVTMDAAALCLKSGNAVILRGGSEAQESNRALFSLIQRALVTVGLPIASAQLLPTQDRKAIDLLLQKSEEIDLVIPRGGPNLIRRVTAQSRIPVVRHDEGICHLYIDRYADLDQAFEITLNAKVQRPGVCNAIETLLVDAEVAHEFLPRVTRALREAGVTLRLDERAFTLCAQEGHSQMSQWPKIYIATERDWATEFLSLELAVRIVSGVGEAIEHIDRYGSRHTASIITQDEDSALRFVREVDASCVLVNASTRFNDGGELGLGAEVGISTTRIHAYGPMGVESLTAEKFVVRGEGHVRA